MKKRRGRRGFWWWSWLLALVAIGATVGGYFQGEKQWEEAPKEFQAGARMSFNVRDPFISTRSSVVASSSTMPDANEEQVIREALSARFLSEIVEKLELAEAWGISVGEVVEQLKTDIDLDLDRETSELDVIVTVNDPEQAASIANAVARAIPALIKRLDESNKAEGLKRLEIEAQPFVDQELEGRTALKKALQARGIALEIKPGIDLGDYLLIPEVLDAKLEWESASDLLSTTQKGQAEYRNYWAKPVRSSMVSIEAEAPQNFIGPAKEPFLKRWSVYGLTAGLMLGSLLTLICWKLFP